MHLYPWKQLSTQWVPWARHSDEIYETSPPPTGQVRQSQASNFVKLQNSAHVACVTEKYQLFDNSFPAGLQQEGAVAGRRGVCVAVLSFLTVTFDLKMPPSAAPGVEENRAMVRRMLREVLVGREDPEGFFALCLSVLGHRETRSQFPSYIQPLSTAYSTLHGSLTAIYTDYFSQVRPAPNDICDFNKAHKQCCLKNKKQTKKTYFACSCFIHVVAKSRCRPLAWRYRSKLPHFIRPLFVWKWQPKNCQCLLKPPFLSVMKLSTLMVLRNVLS